MYHAASQDLLLTHPLIGRENWPKTGPVYGIVVDEAAPRATTLWERLGKRLRKSPDGDNFDRSQARIWY